MAEDERVGEAEGTHVVKSLNVGCFEEGLFCLVKLWLFFIDTYVSEDIHMAGCVGVCKFVYV